MRNTQLHIALFILLVSRLGFAQTCPKVSEAIKAFQAKDLEGAKKNIDNASTDPACSADAATWYYKAFICKDYYRAKESTQKNAPSRNSAIEAARKNIEIDPKNKYAEECKKIINFLSVSYYNDAAKDLNDQKYSSAYDNYVRYLETIKYGQTGKTDTSAIFFAGYSAFMANDHPKAKEYLNKALALKYTDPKLYYYLGKSYRTTGEKDKAYSILNTGLQLYPEDKDILYTLINFYMEDGKLKDLEKTLDIAVQKEPNNLDLIITSALVSEKLSETEKAEAVKYFEKAEKLYKKVIAKDPNNVRANYNLALLYYNKAVNIIDAMDPETPIQSLDKIQDECVIIFKQSLPFMEKAHQLDPKKKEVLEGLAGIYFALNDIPKSDEFKKKAEAANSK